MTRLAIVVGAITQGPPVCFSRVGSASPCYNLRHEPVRRRAGTLDRRGHQIAGVVRHGPARAVLRHSHAPPVNACRGSGRPLARGEPAAPHRLQVPDRRPRKRGAPVHGAYQDLSRYPRQRQGRRWLSAEHGVDRPCAPGPGPGRGAGRRRPAGKSRVQGPGSLCYS